MTQDKKYEKAKSERQKHADAILSSTSRHKIVVAGTGKTYLFKEIKKMKTIFRRSRNHFDF